MITPMNSLGEIMLPDVADTKDSIPRSAFNEKPCDADGTKISYLSQNQCLLPLEDGDVPADQNSYTKIDQTILIAGDDAVDEDNSGKCLDDKSLSQMEILLMKPGANDTNNVDESKMLIRNQNQRSMSLKDWDLSANQNRRHQVDQTRVPTACDASEDKGKNICDSHSEMNRILQERNSLLAHVGDLTKEIEVLRKKNLELINSKPVDIKLGLNLKLVLNRRNRQALAHYPVSATRTYSSSSSISKVDNVTSTISLDHDEIHLPLPSQVTDDWLKSAIRAHVDVLSKITEDARAAATTNGPVLTRHKHSVDQRPNTTTSNDVRLTGICANTTTEKSLPLELNRNSESAGPIKIEIVTGQLEEGLQQEVSRLMHSMLQFSCMLADEKRKHTSLETLTTKLSSPKNEVNSNCPGLDEYVMNESEASERVTNESVEKAPDSKKADVVNMIPGENTERKRVPDGSTLDTVHNLPTTTQNCPYCNLTFSTDYTEEDRLDHVLKSVCARF